MDADILVPLGFFAMVFGIVYFSIKRKERRQLIEKGIDASVIEPKHSIPSSLKWGMVLVGIGVGILLGKLMAAYTTMGDEASMFSMMCLFGGLALVIYYFMERNLEKKDPHTN
jgi:preprotein translocase subunit YajC